MPDSVVVPAPFAVVAREIQFWFAVAVQFNVPPPEFVMLTDCAAGLLDPDVPEYVKLNGEAERPGAGVIVTETFTFCEDGGGPSELTVTDPGVVPTLMVLLAT